MDLSVPSYHLVLAGVVVTGVFGDLSSKGLRFGNGGGRALGGTDFYSTRLDSMLPKLPWRESNLDKSGEDYEQLDHSRSRKLDWPQPSFWQARKT